MKWCSGVAEDCLKVLVVEKVDRGLVVLVEM